MKALCFVALTLLVAARRAARRQRADAVGRERHARCAPADRSARSRARRAHRPHDRSDVGRLCRCDEPARWRQRLLVQPGWIRAATLGPVKLEGSDTLYVLYRIADRRVDRIQFSSPECPLDAGGLTMRWLTGVSAAASLDWLTRFTAGESTRRLQNQAVVAIALHGDPLALDRLLSLARTGKDARLRGDALFWVAQRAGAKAMETVVERDRQRPGHRGQEEGRLCAQPDAEGRGRAEDDRRRPHQPESRGPASGDVLARSVGGPTRAAVLRGHSSKVVH